MSTPYIPPHPSETTYGAIFVALIASAVFYGVTLLQTYLYFRRYPKDPMFLRTMVFVLCFLDTLHLIFCTISIYWYLVINYSNLDMLDDSFWAMNLQVDCNGLIGLSVQFFFARRVWLLSKNWILTIIICTLACMHFGLGVVFTVQAFDLGHFSRYSKLTWITSTGLGCAASADILIALSLCYYLAKMRSEFKRTNSIITTLMIYSINTGALTSIIATSCAVTFAIMPTNFVWLSFFWVLGKCYVNSFLAMLNSRENICEKARRVPTFVELGHLPDAGAPTPPSPTKKSFFGKRGVTLAVIVETTTERSTDYLRNARNEASSPSSSFAPIARPASTFVPRYGEEKDFELSPC
ncbi:hypothetical protein JAAARDRAFT_465119 [Jaapia argillacea MUCL 33604]|uniref:DUF6534 domain-containing protein n=1 Tax=Jaapia argillacea MUCL 33604 TaxID=933084 RepID=A0A067Q6J1_9AGAM|nr:hypothetical protein JAAARDRAFT_465119 [Jaapia argillacea MUCL 33604]